MIRRLWLHDSSSGDVRRAVPRAIASLDRVLLRAAPFRADRRDGRRSTAIAAVLESEVELSLL
jgi:hypothetical protein